MMNRLIGLFLLGVVFYYRNFGPIDERLSTTEAYLMILIAALYFCTADIVDAIKNK